LVIDFTNPTPAIGLNNEERSSFIARTKTDLVLALAVVHHLAIGRNVPFEDIAALFSHLGKNLIVEFVPKEDEKVTFMLQQKRDVYYEYNEKEFLRAFEKSYLILSRRAVGSSGRMLYLLKSKCLN
jgi:hypothetical protein